MPDKTNDRINEEETRAEARDVATNGQSQEYEEAVSEFLANKEQLMREVEMLGKSIGEVTGDGGEDAQDAADGTEGEDDDAPRGNSDSGHIADIISEDGEDVSGAVIWSSSGRKFIIMSADGKPVSDLEADKATELINSRRIAFDGADEQEHFVAEMSSAGVDVDRDRIDISEDGSTGELLVSPENLMGNERHHMSGEHAGGNAEWTDEVDLSDPESTGPQRVEEILSAQAGRSDSQGGTPAKPKRKKISGAKVYHADNILTLLAVFIIVGFYVLVLAFEHPSPAMTGLWSVLCVISTVAVLLPFTMSMETREHNIGGKFILTGGLCLMFILMSAFLIGDVMATGRQAWDTGDDYATGEPAKDEAKDDAVILNFEPSGDIVHLEMTGNPRTYPAVAIGDVLVTTSEAGRASSLVAEMSGKRYVTQTIATIDGLGISAFTVESASISDSIKMAKSLDIGQDVIVYSTGEDGSISIEGATIKSTTFPVGTQGLPEASEVDQVFVDKALLPGDIVMDLKGRLIGIASEAGEGVVTGTSIAKAVNVLTSSDNDLYVGIVCRQASISENEKGGAYVENVMTNSPASNAGIMTGDVIVSVDDVDVDGTDDLDSLIGKHDAGEQVALGIIRDDNEITLSVTIGRGKELSGVNKDGTFKETKDDKDDGAKTEPKPDDKAGNAGAE